MFLDEIPDIIITIFDYFYWVWYFLQNNKYLEISGIVAGVNSKDFTMGHAILANSLYEL